jgi:hypothetical protein
MSNLTINASRFLGFFLEKRNSAQKKKKLSMPIINTILELLIETKPCGEINHYSIFFYCLSFYKLL